MVLNRSNNRRRTIAEICLDIGERGGLIVRPWTTADAPVLVAAWTDAEIAKWNPVPAEATLELARSWIQSTAIQNEASIGVDIVLVETDGGAVVGEIGLQVDPEQVIAEVGFWLAATHRGRGLGKHLLQFAERLSLELELRGLVALVAAENAVATALLTSAAWSELPTKSNRRAFAYRAPTAN